MNWDYDAIQSIALKILAVLGLVLANGFFVAAELALVKIRDTQLDALVLKGRRRAIIARRLIGNLDATISATQFGITLASLGLGVLVEPVFEALLAPVFMWLNVESESVKHTAAIHASMPTHDGGSALSRKCGLMAARFAGA